MADETGLLDAHGRRLTRERTRDLTACPGCGAGKEKREPSSGFGTPHTQCGRCGYEWKDLVWRD